VTVADTTPPPKDTGPDIVDSGAVCPDADLTNLPIPDASLGDGAASPAVCIGCVKTSCSTQLSACNGDCDCKALVVDLFGCIGQGNSPISCVGGLGPGALGNAELGDLAGCILPNCQSICLPGSDGGSKDGSSQDAADDGG
jgi:hypothetical protein